MTVPAYFLAHGAPTLAIEDHAYAQFLKTTLPARLQNVEAVVVFTAHWEHQETQVSRVEGQYEMIYDFGGFQDELYRIVHPAHGDVQLADEVGALLQAAGLPVGFDERRGLDHGTWVILHLLDPEAKWPVVQVSVNPDRPPAEQYEIGRALAPLRERNVLVIGSGGTVHNLRRVAWGREAAEEWAVMFDDWIAEQLTSWNTDALFRYAQEAPHAQDAVPRAEHFVPLLLAMGAGDTSKQAELLHRSYQFGTLSLSGWQFG